MAGRRAFLNDPPLSLGDSKLLVRLHGLQLRSSGGAAIFEAALLDQVEEHCDGLGLKEILNLQHHRPTLRIAARSTFRLYNFNLKTAVKTIDTAVLCVG
jgi:hypothetical protein